MNLTMLSVARAGSTRALSIGLVLAALNASLSACAASTVRPSTDDGGADASDADVSATPPSDAAAPQDSAAPPTDAASPADSAAPPADATAPADSATAPSDAATAAPVCMATSAPSCSDVLPQARVLYEFQMGPAAQSTGGTPTPGCYLARTFALLGGAFGYGPTSMRVIATSATTGVMQIQSERTPGTPAFRVDFDYDVNVAGRTLSARCPLNGFSPGRHRYAVRADGSIEFQWIENDRVTGYMVFSQCAATASGGCS